MTGLSGYGDPCEIAKTACASSAIKTQSFLFKIISEQNLYIDTWFSTFKIMKEKLSLLKELIKLAQCDQKVREQEYEFLLTIARSLEVRKDDFDALFEKYIEFTPPESEFERILQFHRLVLLMNVDQDTSDSEIEFIKDIGIRIGLNPLATNRVLNEMNKYPDKVIPPDKLIAIFKEQYN